MMRELCRSIAESIPACAGQLWIVCEICDEKVGTDMMVHQNCQHKVCRRCWTRWLRSRIENAQPHPQCPMPGCTAELCVADVRKLLLRSPQLVNQWEKLLFDEALASVQRLFRCPTPGCENAVVVPPPKIRQPDVEPSRWFLGLWARRRPKKTLEDAPNQEPQRFLCFRCRRDYCVACAAPWSEGTLTHERRSCNSMQRALRKEQGPSLSAERRSERWKMAHARRCPACNAPIQRFAGCDHMTCGSCRHEFCWRCGGSYNRDAFGLHCEHLPPCITLPGTSRFTRFRMFILARLPELY